MINHMRDQWIYNSIPFDHILDLSNKPARYIYEQYSKIDTVVSDRGHGLMIPLSVGCKILSPISHDKLKWFLDDVGLQRYGIDENNPDLGIHLINRYKDLCLMDWPKVHDKIMTMIKNTNHSNDRLVISYLNELTPNPIY